MGARLAARLMPTASRGVPPTRSVAKILTDDTAVDGTADTGTPLRISKLTFNDGNEVDTSNAEIIVLVGPNNAGKTRTLQETEHFLTQPRLDQRSLFALRDVKVKRVISGE
jgi:hypothetical protein